MGQAFGSVAQLFLGVEGFRGETIGMDAKRRPVTEVGRAIQAHTRAIIRLIRLLKHRAAAVPSEAAAALKELDPRRDLAVTRHNTRCIAPSTFDPESRDATRPAPP
jgi:hypothetical protein